MPRRSPGPIRRGQGDPRGRPRGITDADDDDQPPLGGVQSRSTRGGEFHVRNIPGAAARKDYRCPGCHQEVLSGTAHVVVWPADEVSWTETAVELRRHWHSGCWHRWATRGGAGRPS